MTSLGRKQLLFGPLHHLVGAQGFRIQNDFFLVFVWEELNVHMVRSRSTNCYVRDFAQMIFNPKQFLNETHVLKVYQAQSL